MTSTIRRRLVTLLVLLSMCVSIVQTGSVAATPNQARAVSSATGAPAPAAAAGGGLRPILSGALKHDSAPPLRSITPVAPQSGPARAIPLRRLPAAASRVGPESAGRDPAVQSSIGVAAMPPTTQSFEGVTNLFGGWPPDTNGDVGPNHYVQWINLSFAIWDKSGNLLYGPAAGNTLWSGFGGPCEDDNDGDPIVQYDHLADRWMLSQFAVPGGSIGYHQCIAVSKTGDPTGGYYRYDFLMSETILNDYPKFGVWPDGYYMTINQFRAPNLDFAGAGAVAFERANMLRGLPARMVYFDLASVDIRFGGMLPADLDGPPPPAGAPNYFAEVDDALNIGPNDAMRLWKFHVDWANPSQSTFGLTGAQAGQPNSVLAVAPFNQLPCVTATPPANLDCIPQPGTNKLLDGIGDRLMYRLQYRNFGDHQSLLMNHTVDAGAGRAGIRWYEVRDPGGTPAIFQQATYAPSGGVYRWMGSIAMDRQGNVALGYSASSSSLFPSIRYTGRLSGDPAGALPQGEATMKAGGGSQTGSERWGDYSMMAVDSSDDCTFWYTNEYLPVTSSNGWRTRIGAFKFPTCSAAASGRLEGTITSAAGGAPLANAAVSAGAYSTATDVDGHYQFLSLPPGAYTVTVALYGYASQTASNVSVTSGGTTIRDFALTARASSTVQGKVTDGSGHGWPLYARIDISGSGYPGDPIFTDPATGQYSVRLVHSTPYSFTVSAISGGYGDVTRAVTPPAGGSAENFVLTIDKLACAAPGYDFGSSLLSSGFEGSFPPTGWSTYKTLDPNIGWQAGTTGTPESHGDPHSGASFAWHDDRPITATVDDWLVSPQISIPASGASLSFWQREFYTSFYVYHGVWVTQDTSPDPATSTYTEAWTGPVGELWAEQFVDFSAYAGKTIRLAFRYQGTFSDEWYIDDVRLRGVCQSQAGGLVIGHVYDANTSAGLNGARVGDGAGHAATTLASPGDPMQDDGLFFLAAPAGARTLTASASGGYADDAHSVAVTANTIVKQDFRLKAGRLIATPASLTVTLSSGQTTTRSVALANTGSLMTAYRLAKIGAPAPSAGARPSGPFAEHEERHVDAKRELDRDAAAVYGFDPPEAAPLSAGGLINSWTTGLTYTWGVGFDTSANAVWAGDLAAAGGEDQDHRYQTNGTPTGDAIDISAWVDAFAADMTFNPLTGRLWQVNVGADTCIYELDPTSKTSTGARICPNFGTSERGLAYNPLDDTFYAGSLTDGVINHFDLAGRILDSKNVDLQISGLAFNPSTHHLFALTNHNAGPGLFDIYVLDTNNSYAIAGAFSIAEGVLGAPFDQAGLEIDCAGHLWAVNQVNQLVIEADSGESGVCDWQDVPWLSVTPASGSLGAGGTQALSLAFNTAGLAPGTYRAHVRQYASTPYPPQPIDITFTVVTSFKVYLPLLRK